MAIAIEEHKLGDFFQSIRLGMSITRAARKAGFNPKTYHDWRNRAEADPEAYPEEVAFMKAFWKADADGVALLFGLAHKHAKKDPATVRYLLGLKGHIVKKELKVDATVAHAVEVDASKLTPDQLDALADGRDVEVSDDEPASS